MDILERLEALHEMVAEAEVLSEAKKDDRLVPQATIRNDEYADKVRDGYVIMQRGKDKKGVTQQIRIPAKGFWVHATGAGPVFVAVEKGKKISAGKPLAKWGKKALGLKPGAKHFKAPSPDPERQSGAKKGWETRVKNMMKNKSLDAGEVRGRFKKALKKKGGFKARAPKSFGG